MKIIILLFDRFTALDVAGPYEVLVRLPEAKVFFTAVSKGVYKDSRGLGMVADYSIDEIVSADLLLIPGGLGIDAVMKNQAILSWIQRLDHTTSWTTSVCSGSLLLAEAGLLKGRNCTTHWRRKEQLRNYDVKIINERYAHDGKYVTAAGVSAGIDMALYLAEEISGEQTAKNIQLQIEYIPVGNSEIETLEN
jgi:transcriptional regulator GlxA family with amidase domain